MKKIFMSLWLGLFMLSPFAGCQVPDQRPKLTNDALDRKLTTMLRFSVPLIGVDSLASQLASKEPVIVLDTREPKEYEVSHIPGAIHLGYDQWDPSVLDGIAKDAKVVLYCSVGYRSDKMGKKLREKGFTNVHNLYGSIFEWINQGHSLENAEGRSTRKVHTYNEKWSRWVDPTQADPIW
jgi:rhodanese-related sulfurtransferase